MLHRQGASAVNRRRRTRVRVAIALQNVPPEDTAAQGEKESVRSSGTRNAVCEQRHEQRHRATQQAQHRKLTTCNGHMRVL